jgi:hypothetical protein
MRTMAMAILGAGMGQPQIQRIRRLERGKGVLRSLGGIDL